MIPYHFHFIWMGKNFPFANRLAIESVLQSNPEAEITIHFQDPPDNKHWNSLKSKVNFKEIILEELITGEDKESLLETLNGVASGYPAGKSNLFRYLILLSYGGIYLDFDTLTLQSFKPLLNHKAFIGEEYVFKSNEARVRGEFLPEFFYTFPAFGISWFLTRLNCFYLKNSSVLNAIENIFNPLWRKPKLNNAVLACEPNHAFFKRVVEWLPQRDPTIRFNLGPMLMNDVYNEGLHLDGIHRFGVDEFYYIPPSKTVRFFSPYQALPSKSAIAIHYCSSNEKKRAAALEEDYLKQTPNKNALLFHQLAFPYIEKLTD